MVLFTEQNGIFRPICSHRSRVVYSRTASQTNARWRLVESAWQWGLSKNLVEHDHDSNQLFTRLNNRRVNITSSRDSLNGYQKGRCFYCFGHITIESGKSDLADVDHFFPWVIREYVPAINGIWNLVLAC